MELEEGECVEDDELFTRNDRQKIKDHSSDRHHISSTLKRRSEEDDYETVSMELDSEPEKLKESKSAEQHSEDEVELLRRQLLSQVQKKKARQQTMNEGVSEKQNGQKRAENAESTARKNEGLELTRAKLGQLKEQLTEKQLLQSTVVRRKKRLQESLVKCEAELTRNQMKISSIVEEILGLWSEATKAGLELTLVESKKELRPQRISTDKENSQSDTFDTSENIIGNKQQGEKQHQIATTDGKRQLERATTEDNARKKQHKTIITEDIGGKKQHKTIITEDIGGKKQQENVTTKKQHEIEATKETTGTNSREVEIAVPLRQMVKESDNIDGFLASIRAYRLNPRFSHRLLAHHSVSNRLDPFVPLCPFQLHGRCTDMHCPWQHENEYRMSAVDIVSEVIALWPSICPRGMLPDQYATSLLANDRLEMVVGFLLSIMPEEAFNIKLNASSGIPRLATKPIPTDEDIEFIYSFHKTNDAGFLSSNLLSHTK